MLTPHSKELPCPDPAQRDFLYRVCMLLAGFLFQIGVCNLPLGVSVSGLETCFALHSLGYDPADPLDTIKAQGGYDNGLVDGNVKIMWRH